MGDSLIIPRSALGGLTRIYKDKVCVYMHSINGKVFYIGKGTPDRPFGFYHRNKIWHRIVVDNNGKFEVKILDWFAIDELARLREECEIKLWQPEANMVHNGFTKVLSMELRHRLSLAKIGKHYPKVEQSRTPESMKKLWDASRRQVTDLMTNVTYESMTEAARVSGGSLDLVKRHVAGRVRKPRFYAISKSRVRAA